MGIVVLYVKLFKIKPEKVTNGKLWRMMLSVAVLATLWFLCKCLCTMKKRFVSNQLQLLAKSRVIFYCVILPTTLLFPEVTVPKWAAFYPPSLITLFIAIGRLRSIHLLAFWVLFENSMSLVRTKALVMGLLETGRVQEWVVTEKSGDALKTKLIPQVPNVRFRERVHLMELLVGAYLLSCGIYNIIYGKNTLYVYLLFSVISLLRCWFWLCWQICSCFLLLTQIGTKSHSQYVLEIFLLISY